MIANHHNLLLALPGRGRGDTAADRARLGAADDNRRTTEPMTTTTIDRPPHRELTADQLELQERAREFVENVS